MNYSELNITPVELMIKLGRGRQCPCRMLSPAETHAIRRALPEPEAPIVRTKDGATMTNDRGGVLRDEGGPVYANQCMQWSERLHTVILAVAMGYTSSKEQSWTRASLTDPADGRRGAHDQSAGIAFKDAEATRRAYITAVVADFLGDEDRDGLMATEEIARAYKAYRDMTLSEIVGSSAEGNSGSAQGREAAAETHG